MTEMKESKKDKKARKLEKKRLKERKEDKKLARKDELIKEDIEGREKVEEQVEEEGEQEEQENDQEAEVEEQESDESDSLESDSESKNSKQKDMEEISIDLNATIPLSKKQQRLLKKGKLDLQKLAKKHPAPKPELTKEQQEIEDAKPKKSEYGVWIGNLSFDTTREDIIRFLTAKTKDFIDVKDSTQESDLIKINESDITRFNLPKKERKIKGFAYVDFPSKKYVSTAISLSEQPLNGRKLLIKDANSFEGRPEKDQNSATSLSKNPPSRILFVGNLSFDTTSDLLKEHFAFCGEITKVRMATFEDTGKCKGFAFIDFMNEEGPTNALKSKIAKKLINRTLRLEYGEDRSKRTPKRRDENGVIIGDKHETKLSDLPVEEVKSNPKQFDVEPTPQQQKRPRDDRKSYQQQKPEKRLKSSVALATAQRASAAIVPSSGKKIKFD